MQPFSLTEANDILEDFEDLIDTDFKQDGVLMEVSAILICPFSDPERETFKKIYDESQDENTAISAYGGDEYDVILWATNIAEPARHSFIDIRTFAVQMGIGYRFPDQG